MFTEGIRLLFTRRPEDSGIMSSGIGVNTLKIYLKHQVGYMYIVIDQHVLTYMTVAPTEQMRGI